MLGPLIDVFTEVLQTNTETSDVAEAGKQIRKVLDDAGGTAQLLEQCEQVSAHHGDRYQPLVWRFYSFHRKALFSVIKTLDLSSTTSDQVLIDAMNFICAISQRSSQPRFTQIPRAKTFLCLASRICWVLS